jgi:GAF domain-containing protein
LSGQQESIVDLPSNQQQQSTAPKRQRSASQRAQQQKARLQKQKEFELLKAREEREYLTKFIHLRRTVRALVFVSLCFRCFDFILFTVNNKITEERSIGR